MGIQSIYQIEINGYAGVHKVTISIRYHEPRSGYRHRLGFSIKICHFCMKVLANYHTVSF